MGQKRIKIKTIDPAELGTIKLGNPRTPARVIRFVPRMLVNVGIGWIEDKDEPSPEDFKKYPVVLDAWVNPAGL